jgi:hypothetical protein
MSGVEILNGRQDKAGFFNLVAKFLQLMGGPKFIRVSGHSPRLVFGSRRLIVAGIVGAFLEVVNQMHDDVRATALTRKVIVFAPQHMAI